MAIEEIVDALEMSGIKYERKDDNTVFLSHWEDGIMTVAYNPMTGFCVVTQTWPTANGEFQTATGEYTSRSVESWFNY